jgi:hypothetical protein
MTFFLLRTEKTENHYTGKKIQYLLYILTKWVDSFIVDKRLFIVHIYKKNVDKSGFEMPSLNSMKICNFSRVRMKQSISMVTINDAFASHLVSRLDLSLIRNNQSFNVIKITIAEQIVIESNQQ